MKNKKDKLSSVDISMIIFLIGLGLGIIYVAGSLFINYKISQEVIKYSEEYTKFDECTEIQGKYYCK